MESETNQESDDLEQQTAAKKLWFTQEKSLVQQNNEAFQFCLPHKNSQKDYKEQIGKFFKQEPCLYTPRMYCLSSFVFGSLKNKSKEKSLEEIRLKSAIGQRLKRLINKKQTVEDIPKTLTSSSLWRRIQASDVIKLSKVNHTSLKGSEIITDTIPEEPTENQIECGQNESIEVASSAVFYILETVFAMISQEAEVIENHSDGELLTASDADGCSENQKDEKSRIDTGNSKNVSKSKRKSGKKKPNSAKEMQNPSKKNAAKRTAKSAANLPHEVPEETPDQDLSNDPIPEQSENLITSDSLSMAKVDPLRPENKSILKNTNNPDTGKQLGDQVPNFESEIEKRLSYNLAYETLKYQEYLREILDNSKFFYKYFELIDDFDLVMVILCDHKLRKFQKRKPLSTIYNDSEPEKPIEPQEEIGQETLATQNDAMSITPIPTPSTYSADQQKLESELAERLKMFQQIEDAVYGYKSKLNASLARCRIKLSVSSLLSLLPENVREADKIAPEMFVCCWVNQLKISVSDMISKLTRSGFILVDERCQLVGKRFMFDSHCNEVIFFPGTYFEFLERSNWRKERLIVFQDKSSSLAVHSLLNLASQGLSDVIHVNPGCGLTTCHIASLFQAYKLSSSIIAVGINSINQKRKLMENLDRFGLKGKVQVLEDINAKDFRLADVRLALVTSSCSKSALVNPVHFLLDEGEDLTALKDLAEGCTDANRISQLSDLQSLTLRKVIMLPSIQGIVYYTRSFMESENEGVVLSGLEYFSKWKPEKPPFRVIPSVLPYSQEDLSSDGIQFVGQSVVFQPSRFNNGCFLAVLTKEADDPRETMIQIIARAEAKGIIKSDTNEVQHQDHLDQTRPGNKSAVERTLTASLKHSDLPPQSGAKRKHSTGMKRTAKIQTAGTGSNVKRSSDPPKTLNTHD